MKNPTQSIFGWLSTKQEAPAAQPAAKKARSRQRAINQSDSSTSVERRNQIETVGTTEIAEISQRLSRLEEGLSLLLNLDAERQQDRLERARFSDAFAKITADDLLRSIDTARWGSRQLWELESKSDETGLVWDGTAAELWALLVVANASIPACIATSPLPAQHLGRVLARIHRFNPARVVRRRTSWQRRWLIFSQNVDPFHFSSLRRARQEGIF